MTISPNFVVQNTKYIPPPYIGLGPDKSDVKDSVAGQNGPKKLSSEPFEKKLFGILIHDPYPGRLSL